MMNALSPYLATRPIRCDIFCVVVDNYGDAGVCWRLARQLAEEYGWQVRLYIDNPAPLDLLAPDHAQSPVTVAPWPHLLPPDAPHDSPADVVIETFACTLPEVYTEAMARSEKKPVWLNLDYLSAEDWVGELHGMPSPHPHLPLVKHFFFPGFGKRSGGLLREADYDTRRQAFDAAAFRAQLGLPEKAPNELTISLFSYPTAPVAQLTQALAQADRPIRLLQPGSNAAAFTQGAFSTHPLPFLSQSRFDELLWACDVNFVRGEDSFVRAQWAGKPFVWQIYPQADDAHWVKLDAFLHRYMRKIGADDAPQSFESDRRECLNPPLGRAVSGKSPWGTAIDAISTFWHAWNGKGELNWPAFAAALPALASATQRWSVALADQTNLASNLVQFCLERLK